MWRQVYPVAGDLLHMGEVTDQVKTELQGLGLPREAVRRAGICLYEGETNMVVHARGGKITVTVTEGEILLLLQDRGPGIPDPSRAVEKGFTTADRRVNCLGFGAGMGLPNMQKYADSLHIETEQGVGTTVSMEISYP